MKEGGREGGREKRWSGSPCEYFALVADRCIFILTLDKQIIIERERKKQV